MLLLSPLGVEMDFEQSLEVYCSNNVVFFFISYVGSDKRCYQVALWEVYGSGLAFFCFNLVSKHLCSNFKMNNSSHSFMFSCFQQQWVT